MNGQTVGRFGCAYATTIESYNDPMCICMRVRVCVVPIVIIHTRLIEVARIVSCRAL